MGCGADASEILTACLKGEMANPWKDHPVLAARRLEADWITKQDKKFVPFRLSNCCRQDRSLDRILTEVSEFVPAHFFKNQFNAR
jgi:hypothetical protein